MMLFMANNRHFRQRVMQVFESSPRSSAHLLAMHVGEGCARNYISNGLAFGWELLRT
jgi:hypothetical protein